MIYSTAIILSPVKIYDSSNVNKSTCHKNTTRSAQMTETPD
jgi:hypothetical protein